MKNIKRSIIVGLIAGLIIANSACSNRDAQTTTTPKPSILPTETVAQASSEQVYETWYVNARNGLNCRKEPTQNQSNIIKTYSKGTELQIIGIDNTGVWWETWDGETQGWCHSSYFVSSLEKLSPEIETTSVDYIETTPMTGVTQVGRYLGNYWVTGYTSSPAENGGYSTTAMGDDLNSSVGWAIAVDPNVIPLNSKVYIDGIGYRTARDTGGAIKGNKIDVLTGSDAESYAITGYYDVYLVE